MIKNKANFCVGARVFDLASRFDSEVVPVIVDFPLVLDFRNSAAAAKTFVLVLHFHLGVISIEARIEKPGRRWARDIVLNEADTLAVYRIVGVSDVKPQAEFYEPPRNW